MSSLIVFLPSLSSSLPLSISPPLCFCSHDTNRHEAAYLFAILTRCVYMLAVVKSLIVNGFARETLRSILSDTVQQMTTGCLALAWLALSG